MAAPSAKDLWTNVRAFNAIWLKPDGDAFPGLSYTFVLRGERTPLSFERMPSLHYRRGVSLTLGLDVFLSQLSKCTTRLRHEGKLEGRDVVVADVTGPAFKLVWGNGLRGRWYGYVSAAAQSAEIVFDRETWRPLVSRYGETQIHFLDYVDVADVWQAPLRIVVLYKKDRAWDFRFQVIDDLVWVFDRSLDAAGKVIAQLEDVKLQGMTSQDVRRSKGSLPPSKLKRFEPRQIADRRNLSPEGEITAAIIERNRPWLNPTLDHLKSVDFVHHMESNVLDERFVFRSDGASLVEVVARGDEAGAKEVGRRWITTPEPAYYTAAPKGRLAKREEVAADFCHNHIRNHLMGTRTNFVVLDWGRDPDRFVVADMQLNDEDNTYRIELKPKDRKYHINAGTMFHTTSWAYVHHIRVARSEVVVDADTLRPVRETDYSGEEAKLCEVEFLGYQDVGQGRAVPQQIHLWFPGSQFNVRYRFEWRSEGLWILTTGEGRFEETGSAQQEEIRDLKINQPTPALDDALALVRRTRDYLEPGPEGEKLFLGVWEFALGKRINCGPATVLFTMGDRQELIAEVRGIAPEQAAVALFDATGRLLACGSAGTATTEGVAMVRLGSSKALAGVQRFALAGVPAEAPLTQSVVAYRLSDAAATPVEVSDQENGKTRVKRFRVDASAAGTLTVAAELVSQDHDRWFKVDVCALLVGNGGRPLAAASDQITFKIRREIGAAAATLTFEPSVSAEDVRHVALGVSRDRDLGHAWHRGRWMSLGRGKGDTVFPVDRLLAGDDPRVWKVGLDALDATMRGKRMEYELFSNERDYRRAVKRGWLRSATIGPHAPRIAQLLRAEDDPDALALAGRLLGHAGQQEWADDLAGLLSHSSDVARDGAAVGLGLLGDDRGLERLAPVLGRALPEEREARKAMYRWHTDAALALRGIGTETAVRALGAALLGAIDGIVITPREGGGSSASGSYTTATRVAQVLGRTPSPVALDCLRQARRRGDKAERVERYLLEAMAQFKEQAHDAFVEGIRQGDAGIVGQVSRSRDAFYLPYVCELVRRDDVSEGAFVLGAKYLSKLGSPEALAALRDLYDRNVRGDSPSCRVRLCRMLADNKDYRGLEYAFSVLVGLYRPHELPEDPEERKAAESERKSLAHSVTRIFYWEVPKPVQVSFLGPKLAAQDAPTKLAALRVLEDLRRLQAQLRPAVDALKDDPNKEVADLAAKVARR